MKSDGGIAGTSKIKSPSMRREWIEMLLPLPTVRVMFLSPSMRREWIEISDVTRIVAR